MNHALLSKLIIKNQSNNYNVCSFSSIKDSPNTHIRVYPGIEIVSRPDGTWSMALKASHIQNSGNNRINDLTGNNFIIRKKGPRKYVINGDTYIGEDTVVEFAADDTFTVTGVLEMKDFTEQKKALHKLTRRVRKKVQPQIRLLGQQAFDIPYRSRKYHYREEAKEITAIMKVLDAEEVFVNMTALRDVWNDWDMFGCADYREEREEFKPKRIIDKFLRRVGVHKIAIMEKYDERARRSGSNTQQGESTRRAA